MGNERRDEMSQIKVRHTTQVRRVIRGFIGLITILYLRKKIKSNGKKFMINSWGKIEKMRGKCKLNL